MSITTITSSSATSRHALADEFELDETLGLVANAFPTARRAKNHTVCEYLRLGQSGTF